MYPVYCGLFALLLLCSCEKFEYSPYQTTNGTRPANLNATNLNKLLATEANGNDTLTILFTGDSQRSYRSLHALVAKANSIAGIDLLILAGDISDFALLQDFLWIHERLEKLKIPYLCVIGNHDLTARGAQIYEEMFGPKDFSFSYKGYKFLFHDTNGREYDFNGHVPDVNWLSGQLNDTTPQWFIGVSHVPPYDMDFDRNLEIPYKNLFASEPRFLLSLNGHIHTGGDSFYYHDHVRYLTSYSVDHDQFVLLKLINGSINKKLIAY